MIIRQVWAHNLERELALIAGAIPNYPLISFDTEFPGVVFNSDKHPAALSTSERYSLMKSNVDILHLIQLGLTLSDLSGQHHLVWEFNFRDFNIFTDVYSPDSIKLLRSSGIDFIRNIVQGVDSQRFASLLIEYGIVGAVSEVNWVTFHGAYDFAYLIKMLSGGAKLPESLEEFLEMVRIYFGEEWWDVKHMMKYCDHSLYGGLEKVAAALKVDRVVGMGHQAGSDSLLTCQTFVKMKNTFFNEDGGLKHAGVLFGLELIKA
ncbi:Ribonuclease CAF1 protein [Dioscorea alata]|uniref:Ribonuclease CAF1 protein n=1 Tax=Dioscorea alata TaxID=55571 RepID=A0ACB7VCS5_DIOAL|nr:Ribonuclease CAF1 protein [Dioscorea alata]